MLAARTIPALACLFLAATATAPCAQAPQGGAADANKVYDDALWSQLRYRCIGPNRGGRATTVAGVTQQPNTFFMGATGGGVWKTTDAGATWNNVSDGFFSTGSIGAIRVAASDPDVVWVGTGSDGMRSNVITGRGIYRSGDAGKTWEFKGLYDAGQIGAVEIHPKNPDVVYVAVIGNAFAPSPERGVYRTTDGGKNWKKVLFVSETCGAVDLELNTANPDEIYASMWRGERKPWTIISGGKEGGIYKSTDRGDNWKKLTVGLPQGIVGKSDLAVTFAAPGRLYALIEAPSPNGGLYRSEDAGESFELISQQRGLLDRPFYYCNVDADPRDPDVVWVNATGCHKSTDGGKSWSRQRTPHGDNHDIWINPENTNLIVQSNDGGANVSTDGGRSWSTQRNQPTAELYQVAVDDRFPYWVYAGQQDNSTLRVPSNTIPSGRRGRGGFGRGRGAATETTSTANWESVGGCETGPVVPKPGDADIVYAGCKGKFGVYNARLGYERAYPVGAANMYGHNPKDLKYRFQRVSPIHVSPHDPDVVYHCSQYVHRTSDDGVTWETISPDLTAFTPETQVFSGTPITRDITGEEHYSTLYALEESKLTKGLIWVGANDGPVHVTRDNGKNWKNVTPPDLPPGGRVKAIEPSPHNPAKAYFATYRFLLGDFQPYIYRTNNYGATWTRLTTGRNGIPADTPTRVIREDPDREGLLYAGTDFGMYVSFDDGAHWQSLQLNLPVTPITGIVVHQKDVVISTMGRSFWILDDVSPLHQVNDRIAQNGFHMFAPRDAYRLRGGGNNTASSGQIPETFPTGARIHYYLAAAVDGEMKIELMDDTGAVVRTYSSKAPAARDVAAAGGQRQGEGRRGGRGTRGARAERTSPMTEGREGMPARFRPPERVEARLQKTAGAHVLTWDLAKEASQAAEPTGRGRFRGFRGRGRSSTVVPGPYQARLTIGGKSQTVAFEVKIDPRLEAEGITGEDLRAQAALQKRVSALSARGNALSRQISNRERELQDLIEAGGANAGAAREAMARLIPVRDRVITKRGGAYPQPMLTSQIGTLSGAVGRAEQRPGNHAYMRLVDLTAEVESCEAAFKAVGGPKGEGKEPESARRRR